MKRLIFLDVFTIVFFAACGDNALPAEPTCFREPDYDAGCVDRYRGEADFGFLCEDGAPHLSPAYPYTCYWREGGMCCTTED